MIDAKELRIGNWIERLGGSQFQITPKDILRISEMPANLTPNPIPLTPEVLEACEGVKRTPNADWFDWVVCGLNINYNADEDVYFIYEYPNVLRV